MRQLGERLSVFVGAVRLRRHSERGERRRRRGHDRRRDSSLGRIVADGKGRTLYLFEKDHNHRSACYGPCATYWPPLLTHGKPLARGGANQSLLGTTRRANGGQQITYAGHPVYRFVNDTKPGQTTGEGSQAFGAGWDALTPTGKKIEADG